MINTPLIEIELQPTAPALYLPAERLEEWNSFNSHLVTHLHSVE
jgi:hypothetical protein